ncbi:MAG: hypothetical protein QOI36_1094, partial [Pseudonocardiales bacterium]|nr:hypothetical protein [Pseudonocardiales bacterium]
MSAQDAARPYPATNHTAGGARVGSQTNERHFAGL